MSDRQSIFETVTDQIGPFNKKGVALTDATTFAGDLEWDSLTVMDFVAAVEKHPENFGMGTKSRQDIEAWAGQMCAAVTTPARTVIWLDHGRVIFRSFLP